MTPTITIEDNEPRLAGKSIGAIVHACHVATIDQGLDALALPGLTRGTLEPVLQYCAEVRCAADNVSCPGCKRRTEALGLETLDQYILSKKEVVVGDGRVRLQGEGTEMVTTPCLESLTRQWSGRELLVLGTPRHSQTAPRNPARSYAGRTCRWRRRNTCCHLDGAAARR